MKGLSTRSLAQEQMDAAELHPADYAALLADLTRVNAWTLAARPTLAFLDRVTKRSSSIRLLDVGFGHGDMLRRIAHWATRRGMKADLVGIDLNPRSAEIASSATDPSLGIDFRSGDYAALAGEHWDFIVSSLVAHHMSHDQLVHFLRFMASSATHGWLINDLHRHRLSYMGYPWLARAMGWHRIVREDGTLSIARAYRPSEWAPLLAEADIRDARVYRAFPFRLCVEQIH